MLQVTLSAAVPVANAASLRFDPFARGQCPDSMRGRVHPAFGHPSVRLSVRLSVCPSVRPSVRLSVRFIRPLHAPPAGLLLWARRPGDIDRLLHGRRAGGQQQLRRGTT